MTPHTLASATSFSPSRLVGLFFLLCVALPTSARERAKAMASPDQGRRVSSELSGTLTTKNGLLLRLDTVVGSVHIRTESSDRVDYRVRVETEAARPDAQEFIKRFRVAAVQVPEGVEIRGKMPGKNFRGPLWVTFDLNVPRNYGLIVSSGGGNLEAGDVTGSVTFTTLGGNIRMGNINGPARLETGGGHICVRNVSGELYASTGGGHITAGHIGGGAILHTEGGHIRATSVAGTARFETGGGNISLEKSNSELVADTGGGQIEVGDAAGTVRARTRGGGIRVAHLFGPTRLETGGGSIFLTQVNSAVRATTGEGGITAWFASDAKLPSSCELESGVGDIVVYIPRQLPLTVDAQIQQGNEHRLVVDPALPLKLSYNAANGKHSVRAEGALNGGGEVLRLRTVAGNIQLLLSDTSRQMQILKQQMERIQKQVEEQLRAAQAPAPPPPNPPAPPR